MGHNQREKAMANSQLTVEQLRELLGANTDRDPGPGCWIWKGPVTGHGYGQLATPGAVDYTHRLAYELRHGPIAPGLHIDHLCSVRRCCNPDHLEAVSRLENWLRGQAGTAARQNLCKRGHRLTLENTKLDSRGDRYCRTCHNAWAKAYYHAHRDEILARNRARAANQTTIQREKLRARRRELYANGTDEYRARASGQLQLRDHQRDMEKLIKRRVGYDKHHDHVNAQRRAKYWAAKE